MVVVFHLMDPIITGDNLYIVNNKAFGDDPAQKKLIELKRLMPNI
jgi:hypothetical protein